MLITCSNCGHKNQSDALFCDECGEELATNNSLFQGETTMHSEETYTEFTQSEINSITNLDRETSHDDIPTEIVVKRETDYSDPNNSAEEFTPISENETTSQETESEINTYYAIADSDSDNEIESNINFTEEFDNSVEESVSVSEDEIISQESESETNAYNAIAEGDLDNEIESTPDFSQEFDNPAEEFTPVSEDEIITQETEPETNAYNAIADADSDNEIESTTSLPQEFDNPVEELADSDTVTNETDYQSEATDAIYSDTDSPDRIDSNEETLETDADNSDLEPSVEESASSSTFEVPTLLQLDDTSIQETVSPATTLEVYQKPKAILIERGSQVKFVLPSTEKIAYIGRSNNEFPIQIDLSAINAAIHQENEDFYLEDSGSANGTWLNNRKIKPGTRFRQKLNPGDTIAFGRNQAIALTFELEA